MKKYLLLTILSISALVTFSQVPISTITGLDANGEPVLAGNTYTVTGIVHGVDLNGSPTRLQFTIIDDTDGISTYSGSSSFGYTVQEGDSVVATGTLGHFNGLTQLTLDTVYTVGVGRSPLSPRQVSTLDESTESDIVELKYVSLVDPLQWTGSGSGFNVDVSDGTNTYTLRIDNDIDLYSMPAPTGVFNVAGIGGQFDNTVPRNSGYQLLPRYAADITSLPHYNISDVHGEDVNGNADSLGVICRLTGVVHGVNTRASATGTAFTIMDATGGIATYNGTSTFGYNVTEGDEVTIGGYISQFNGLTQMYLDTIFENSSGNSLNTPLVVTSLDESTESRLIRINGVSLVSPVQWTNSGSGFTVDLTDGSNNFQAYIDNDCSLYGQSAPVGSFDLIGIGGQYDNSAPRTEGYQIYPRYTADLIPAGGGNNGIPSYTIATVTTEDGSGVADSVGVECSLTGVVYGVNTRASGTGTSFTIRDATGGIVCFNSGSILGYNVTEGDQIRVYGDIGQFNGMTQIYLDSIDFVSSGNSLVSPTVVTALNESTESELVRINNLSLVTPSQWTGTGSGFTVNVTDGSNNFEVRIDNDCSLYGQSAPSGTFDLIGLGGQYDATSPYTDGYQLYPRYTADLIPAGGGNNGIPSYTIATVTTEDGSGVADSVGVECSLTGVVYGVNTRASGTGTSFTIRDATGGIVCFNSGSILGYNVTEGDQIRVYGDIGQFNGMTQIYLDSIDFVSSGNSLVSPTVVTALNESTESELVRINNLSLVTPSQWTGTGSGFTVDVTDGSNNFEVRIDNDCSLYGQSAPSGTFDLIGLGGQYDATSPYTDGYQLYPRYTADLIPTGGPNPNPAFFKKISEIQTPFGGGNDSPYLDSTVQTGGVVTAVRASHGFWIQESNGGAYSGVYVFDNGTNTPTEGDSIVLTGDVDEFFDLTEIVNVTSFTNVSSGNPYVITDVSSGAANNEMYEGVMVKVVDANCVVDSNQFGAWIINDGSGDLEVDDPMFGYDPVVDTSYYYDVTGVVSYSFGDYELLPRYASDIVLDTTGGGGSGPGFITEGNNVKSVYPNPAKSTITVELTEFNGNTSISILDVTGRTIDAVNTVNITNNVSVSDLKDGVYFIQIITDDSIDRVKFIKK